MPRDIIDVCTLSALAVFAVAAVAAPVDPPADVPTRVPGPTPAIADLSVQLRGCLRCHGHAGPNTRMFDARGQLLPGLDAVLLRGNIKIALGSDKYGPRTDAERRDMVRVLKYLSGK